ncbi:MAG: transglycosylase SLT domain-containing protein [Pseudomonadales bacterium]|nr:transglycosylase SLT domain-containing protein [Pseudomonadales bacterium]
MIATWIPPFPGAWLMLLLVLVAGCQAPGGRAPDHDPQGERRTTRATEPAPAPTRPGHQRAGAPGPAGEDARDCCAADEDLWALIRAGFRLERPLDQPRVRAELNELLRFPGHLQRLGPLLELYLPHIFDAVQTRGLPAELALLPIIESGMDPQAGRVGGPSGLWQFLPATAERLDVPRSWWFEGRHDPVISTRAALDYLEYHHAQFGSWPLALTAYNVGEGTVRRALAARGGSATFWALRLPAAGMAFVPKLLALAEVVADPARYGVTLPPIAAGATFVTLPTGGQIEIAKAARALGLAEDYLYQLNPGLNRSTTPPDGPHLLHVPVASADQAGAWLASLGPEDRSAARAAARAAEGRGGVQTTAAAGQDRVHVVRAGETLWGIARTYRIKLDELVAHNALRRNAVLRIGQRLVIPRR